jgi:hypothetical protein
MSGKLFPARFARVARRSWNSTASLFALVGVLGILTFLSLTGCVTLSHDGEEPTPMLSVPIVVRNDGTTDAIVYACRLGACAQIGVVGAFSTQVLHAPPSFTGDGDIQLALRPVGGQERFMMQAVHVRDGQHPVVDIENALHASTLFVDAN